MPGRNRKPTHLKLITGTARKDRLNPCEPKPKRAIPKAPSHLSKRAKTAWPNIAKILNETGVLTVADGLALEMLCEAYADYLGAREDLKRLGGNYYETTNESGAVISRPHPAVAMVRDADRRIRGYLTDFGLTPSARAKVSALPETADDLASKYLD